MSSSIPPPPPTRQLSPDDGPLIWIDCEMTGLETTDRILEIAVVVTDGQLVQVDDGVQYVVKTDKALLDGMGEWCTAQHAKSGLTNLCLSSPHSLEEVSAAVLKYIRDRVPAKGVACLAGNTVHADKAFLAREMPEIIDHLHYRIVDVSSLKELSRRWYPSVEWRKKGGTAHRAYDDILASIKELKFYRRALFRNIEEEERKRLVELAEESI